MLLSSEIFFHAFQNSKLYRTDDTTVLVGVLLPAALIQTRLPAGLKLSRGSGSAGQTSIVLVDSG